MLRHVTNLPKGYRKRRERPEPAPWRIRVSTTKSAAGFVDVVFDFLPIWLDPETARRFEKAVNNFARQKSAPTAIYHVRQPLESWMRLTIESKSTPPSPAAPPAQILADLTALRLQYFIERDAAKIALNTIVAEWRDFLNFLPDLIREKAICRFDFRNGSIAAPNGRLFEFSRDEIGHAEIKQNLAPKTYRFDLDSYNDELFEDISISASSDEALADFEFRLERAVRTIYDAAWTEFNELIDTHELGKRLVTGVDYKQLMQIADVVDEKLGHNPFSESHPDSLANLLALVVHEMGGIPKPWGHSRVYAGQRPPDLKVALCAHVVAFGKNRLLPYLGLLTSTAALSCTLLLMMEHPNLNATTVLNLEIDEHGELLANLSSVGEHGKVFDALKLRAGKMVSGALTPVSQLVLEKVVEWTHPMRVQLVADGHIEMARRLWIGMSSRDYHLTAFSSATLTKQIGLGARRRFGSPAERFPMTSFEQRHPEIKPWAPRLNLKALRKNMGVLDFLRSNGNLVRLARLLGHKSVTTTIKSYIPLPLRLALYERQIRRHQNLMIAAAFGDLQASVSHTDFSSTEELHTFLSSILCRSRTEASPRSESEVRSLLEQYLDRGERVSISHGANSSPDTRLVITRDPMPLAAAFLYAEHLNGASNYFLDKPDVVTGVPPRFWRDFAESINSPLPDALYELHELVQQARVIASDPATDFVFPKNG